MELPVITGLHWLYLFVVFTVIVAMLFRRDVVLPCLIGIFAIGFVYTGYSVIGAAQTTFTAMMVAGTDLFDIMLVIALMVSMLKSMQSLGADVLMIAPIKKMMKTPTIAFFGLTFTMYVAATFFWPTPATALVGTILIPVAIAAGLPPMAAAQALNIGGHGTALAGDLVLQGAPAITSGAANVDIGLFIPKAAMLTFTVGIVALIIAYFLNRKDFGKLHDSGILLKNTEPADDKPATATAKFFAFFVPVLFFTIVVAMVNLDIKGGDATSLLGGTGVTLMLIMSVLNHGADAMEKIVEFLKDGLLFAVKIFAPVIPIAGFFFMGSPEPVAQILGEGAPGFMFELGTVFANQVPLSALPLAIGIVLIGVMTGLDGSGFSGLPLVGALAASLGGPAGVDIVTLAALGQIAAVWTGGGTLTAWAFGVVADAGIANVSPIDLVRRNFLAVIPGLIVAAIVAVILM